MADNPADAHRLLDTPIEDPVYDAATHCAARTRPGMLELQRWLEHNVRGVFWGSYRCEKWGKHSASLHAENRAIDWHLDVRSAADRRAAANLIALLLAPDRAGNPQALARRMGVEEIIWDCGYWGAGMSDFNPYSPCFTSKGKPKLGRRHDRPPRPRPPRDDLGGRGAPAPPSGDEHGRARHTGPVLRGLLLSLVVVAALLGGAWLAFGSSGDAAPRTAAANTAARPVAKAAVAADTGDPGLPPLPSTMRPQVVQPVAGSTGAVATQPAPAGSDPGLTDAGPAPTGPATVRRPAPGRHLGGTGAVNQATALLERDRAPAAGGARGDQADDRGRQRRSPARRTSGAAATASGSTRATTAPARSRSCSPPPATSGAARLRHLMPLGRARAGQVGHDLRERRPRLHGGRGHPLRHLRPARDRLALAERRTPDRRASRSVTRRVCDRPGPALGCPPHRILAAERR